MASSRPGAGTSHLLSGIEAASRRLAEERQRYFDATSMLSTMQRRSPLVTGGATAAAAAAFESFSRAPESLYAQMDQDDAAAYHGNRSHVSFKEPLIDPPAIYEADGVPMPFLPPPPACEDCLILRAAVSQLQENLRIVEGTYIRRLDQAQDTVTFVEGERQEARRKFENCFAELQAARTQLLERDGRVLEERGRAHRLELLLDSEARRSAHASTATTATTIASTQRELMHLCVLEQSERSSLLASILLQMELKHVTFLWGLDVLQAERAAKQDEQDRRAAASVVSPTRRAAGAAGLYDDGSDDSPVTRVMADVCTSPVPTADLMPPRTVTSVQDDAHSRTLRAEIDSLRAERDLLVDHLATARVQTAKLQRQVKVLQESAVVTALAAAQMPSSTAAKATWTPSAPSTPAAVTPPAMNLPGAAGQSMSSREPEYELTLSELRDRQRHSNFQAREFFQLVLQLVSNVGKTAAKERKSLEVVCQRAQARAEEEAKMADAARASADVEIASLQRALDATNEELRAAQTAAVAAASARSVASASTSAEPATMMRSDVGTETVSHEDTERELTMLRRLLMEARAAAEKAQAELEEARRDADVRAQRAEVEAETARAVAAAAPPPATLLSAMASSLAMLDTGNSSFHLPPPPPPINGDGDGDWSSVMGTPMQLPVAAAGSAAVPAAKPPRPPGTRSISATNTAAGTGNVGPGSHNASVEFAMLPAAAGVNPTTAEVQMANSQSQDEPMFLPPPAERKAAPATGGSGLPTLPADKLPPTREDLTRELAAAATGIAAHVQTAGIAASTRLSELASEGEARHAAAMEAAERHARRQEGDVEKLRGELAGIKLILRNLVSNASHHQRMVTKEVAVMEQLAATVSAEAASVRELTESFRHGDVAQQLTHSQRKASHGALSFSSVSPSPTIAGPPPALAATASAAALQPSVVGSPPITNSTLSAPADAGAAKAMPAFQRPAAPHQAAQPAKATTAADVIAATAAASHNFDASSDDEAPPQPTPPPAAAAVAAVKEAPAQPPNSLLSNAQAAALRPKPKPSPKK
jgi:hypothetical protein